MHLRSDGRSVDELRKINIQKGLTEYADGSILFSLGKTKVQCTVTMQSGVPFFLRGKQQGWLTAEYAMLPTATPVRRHRDGMQNKPNGRSVEISRIIGRSLRTIIDFSCIPDVTLTVDCDVLQADGGTRTASIIGSYIALQQLQKKMLRYKKIEKPFLVDGVIAVSVGVAADMVYLDPNAHEDAHLQADFNVIVTTSGKVIEIQGGAETGAISWQLFDEVKRVALIGVDAVDKVMNPFLASLDAPVVKKQHGAEKTGLFSLKNRLSL